MKNRSPENLPPSDSLVRLISSMRSPHCGIAISGIRMVAMPAAGVAAFVVMVVAPKVGAGRESSGEIRFDRRL